jgi:hypothetical protein
MTTRHRNVQRSEENPSFSVGWNKLRAVPALAVKTDSFCRNRAELVPAYDRADQYSQPREDHRPQAPHVPPDAAPHSAHGRFVCIVNVPWSLFSAEYAATKSVAVAFPL